MGTENWWTRRDWFWKILPIIVTVIAVPFAGWVWSTEGRVSRLEERSAKVEKLEVLAQETSGDVRELKKDVEYIKNALMDIKDIVKRMETP